MRIVSIVVAAFIVACSSSEGTQTTDEQLAGGCRMVCPRCTPNMDVCPMIACELDCHGKPDTCVETMMCPIGYAWNKNACSCEPTKH